MQISLEQEGYVFKTNFEAVKTKHEERHDCVACKYLDFRQFKHLVI